MGDSTHFPTQKIGGNIVVPVSQRWRDKLHQIFGEHTSLLDARWFVLSVRYAAAFQNWRPP